MTKSSVIIACLTPQLNPFIGQFIFVGPFIDDDVELGKRLCPLFFIRLAVVVDVPFVDFGAEIRDLL